MKRGEENKDTGAFTRGDPEFKPMRCSGCFLRRAAGLPPTTHWKSTAHARRLWTSTWGEGRGGAASTLACEKKHRSGNVPRQRAAIIGRAPRGTQGDGGAPRSYGRNVPSSLRNPLFLPAAPTSPPAGQEGSSAPGPAQAAPLRGAAGGERGTRGAGIGGKGVKALQSPSRLYRGMQASPGGMGEAGGAPQPSLM